MKRLNWWKSRRFALAVLLILVVVCGLAVRFCWRQLHGPRLVYTGYGGNRTVSGSLHVVEMAGEQLILDAGSFFGEEGDSVPRLPETTARASASVLISHAHTDHVGRLPELVEKGFANPIYMTRPTARLLPVMLEMNARFSDYGSEAFYYSAATRERRGAEDGSTPVHTREECEWGGRIAEENREELEANRSGLMRTDFHLCYTCVQKEVEQVTELVQVERLREEFTPASGVEGRFYSTPHIPGAVMIRLEDGEGRSLLYTGDYGSGLSPFLPPQDEVVGSDWAVVEGTYPPEVESVAAEKRAEFRQFVGRALRSDKRVIIPAFVLDRTQQVLFELTTGMEQGVIPRDTEINVYSPTAKEINGIYASNFRTPAYEPYFSVSFMEEGPFAPVFNSPSRLQSVDAGEIAICSPGMADSGHAREYVERYVDDPDTVFVFVGYLRPDSLGARLYSKADKGEETQLEIDDRAFAVRAEAERFSAFSGHGRFEEIRDFLSGLEGLEGIIIVHSAEETALRLEEAYERSFPGIEILVPEAGERYVLD